MSHPPDHDVDELTRPAALLRLLDAFDSPTIVGFEPTRHHLEVHARPLRFDPRAIGAGLFGVRARSGWCAAGVVICGRMRSLDDHDATPLGATGRVVVDRRARLASSLDGHDRIDGPVSGVVVDALHRVLDLPAPGEPPHPARLALALWCTEVLARAHERGVAPEWAEVVAAHPGDPGSGAVLASVETIVEATLRCAPIFDWERVHRRAALGSGALPRDLRRSEAAWMDPVMYGRWVLDTLADPLLVVEVLSALGATDAAHRLARVVTGVAAEVPADPHHIGERRPPIR